MHRDVLNYRDVLNNYLNVGDIVVYGDQQTNTNLGYIMKFCPTKVKIRCLCHQFGTKTNNDSEPVKVYELGTCLRYAKQLVKVTIPNLEIVSKEGN